MSLGASAQQQRILVWMCIFIGINQLGFGALIPVLPLYAQAFGVSASAIGITISVYGLARMFSAMPAGQLSDTLGRRESMAIGGALSAAGNLWCALATSFPEFVIARFVAGLGAGWVQSVGIIVLADVSAPHQRGRMMSIYQGTFLFAVGVGPFPGGLLASYFGLASPFATYAVASAIAAVLAWVMVPETRGFAHGDRPAAQAVGGMSYLKQMRILLSDLGYTMVCLMGLTNAIVRTGGLFNLVPLLAVARLDLGPGAIGGWLALGSLLGLVASYPAGVVADRIGRKPVIVPSALLTGAAFLVFWWAPSMTWFAIACALWGIAAAVNGAAPAAYAADKAPAGMNAAAMSGYRGLSDIGYVIGPVMLGLLADWRGAQAGLLVSAVLVAAVGLLFGRYAPEQWKR